MRTSVLAALAGMSAFGLWVAAVAGVLLGALLLSVAFRVVVGHLPSYLRAVGTVILTLAVTSLALLVLGLVLPGGVGRLFGAAVMFLVGVAVINRVLYTETGLAIGYARAALVQLAYMVVAIFLALAFGSVPASRP
jgi:hypothetical protein